MGKNNNKQESPSGLALAVVSAFGLMSEPGRRYQTVIKASDGDSLKKNFKEYLKSEIKRAQSDEAIMESLEKIDLESAIEAVDLSGMDIQDGGLDVVQVMYLLTDYHLEYKVYPSDSPIADADEYIVMLDGCGPDEFATVAHIFNPRDEEQCEACSSDDSENGIVRGPESEVAEQLLGWERISLKAFNP